MDRMPSKDPDATKDYQIDWGTSRLAVGETITTSTWIVPTGLTQGTTSNTTTTTTIWLSGGTAGTDYTVTNRVVTNQGRTDDWSLQIFVTDQ